MTNTATESTKKTYRTDNHLNACLEMKPTEDECYSRGARYVIRAAKGIGYSSQIEGVSSRGRQIVITPDRDRAIQAIFDQLSREPEFSLIAPPSLADLPSYTGRALVWKNGAIILFYNSTELPDQKFQPKTGWVHSAGMSSKQILRIMDGAISPFMNIRTCLITSVGKLS